MIENAYENYKKITVDEEEILKEELKKLQGEIDNLRISRGIREKTSEEIKINKKAALLIGINYSRNIQ